MRSLDRQLIPELSPEAEATRLRLRVAFTKRVLQMESWMLDGRELQGRETLPLSEERIKRIHAWLEGLAMGEEGIPEEVDERVVGQTVEEYTRLLMALLDVREGRDLPKEIWRLEYDLAPEEFFIDREDIPTWNELPSADEIKANFVLDWIPDKFYQGRKLKDPADVFLTTKETLKDRKGFEIVDQDLLNVKYAENDPLKRAAFLRSVDTDHLPEVLPPARIFDIADIIAKKKQEDPNRPNSLTTQELLEAFDEAGVRPATLKELLVFSKRYWKLKKIADQSFTPKEVIQRANASCVQALGSVFWGPMHNRGVASLSLIGDSRRLTVGSIERPWYTNDRFLVFRKA